MSDLQTERRRFAMKNGYPFFTEIVISVRKRHCRGILSLIKTAELRSRMLPIRYDERPVRAFMYETKAAAGAGAVVGEFLTITADPVHRDDPGDDVLSALQITAAELRSYLARKETGIGYSHPVLGVVTYEHEYPVEDFGLSRAPQSWQYARRIPEDLQRNVSLIHLNVIGRQCSGMTELSFGRLDQ